MGGGALGEMKEEWETCMSHKDRLPDLCAFVSASSWRSRA